MDVEMERQGVEVLGINHKGKRYFISRRYKGSQRLAAFLFGNLMSQICRETPGENVYLFLLNPKRR